MPFFSWCLRLESPSREDLLLSILLSNRFSFLFTRLVLLFHWHYSSFVLFFHPLSPLSLSFSCCHQYETLSWTKTFLKSTLCSSRDKKREDASSLFPSFSWVSVTRLFISENGHSFKIYSRITMMSTQRPTFCVYYNVVLLRSVVSSFPCVSSE